MVPEYVKIKSIEELNPKAAFFNNKIIGIDLGAGIMNKAEIAIKDYHITLEL